MPSYFQVLFPKNFKFLSWAVFCFDFQQLKGATEQTSQKETMSSFEVLEIKAPDEFVTFPETYENIIKKHEDHNTTPEQGFIYFTS